MLCNSAMKNLAFPATAAIILAGAIRLGGPVATAYLGTALRSTVTQPDARILSRFNGGTDTGKEMSNANLEAHAN